MPRTAKVKKSEPKTQSNGNGIAALTAQLWQAAVNLRGSIEPADYKRYVLPIIFLRFLSLRYERRRAELERLITDPASEYYTRNRRDAAEILADADEYRRAGAFIVPENARWSKILEQAQADDIKVRLDDILDELERTYPDKLRGLLPRIYAGSNLDRENVTALINLFSKDIFEQDHGGEDLIGRVYEYFIGEFASSEGKRGGSTSRRCPSSARWWRCWSRSAAWFSTPAAALAACSCRPTSSPATTANSVSSDRRARTSPTACAA
jgi:type I restriction-modification system DNA methylase subunit